MNKTYSFSKLDSALLSPATELCKLIGISLADDGIAVTALKADKPAIAFDGNTVTISYNKKCEFFRMLAMADSVLVGEKYEESPRHNMLCYMLDQSRNAVLTQKNARNFALYLAACGYDSLMLYTEDTYEMDGEPYFGYMRGKWTKEQIKAMDDFCDSLGIELIPCIQTLAHLERALRWRCYAPYIDCENILLVGDEKVQALIEKMFITARECFRSNKIDVGLDEAHMLGLGKYLDKHGYEKCSEVMKKHLEFVSKLADKYGFKPMMWSDMFFRAAFNDQYYVKDGRIPKEILDTVPANIVPIYWDYYNEDVELFTNMVKAHTDFNNEVAFAGGLQRWGRFCAINEFSIRAESMHIDICLENGIKNIIGTAWGDDGSEAAVFSILPTMALYAEKCYKGDFERSWLDTRVAEIFGISTEPFTLMDAMEYQPDFKKDNGGRAPHSKVLFYADLLAAQYYKHIDRDFEVAYYTDLAEKFLPFASNEKFGYIFETMHRFAKVLAYKCALIKDIRDSYDAGDKAALSRIANETIPEAVSAVSDFLKAFEAQWKRENLTFGLETQQIRIGGLMARMSGVADIINDYLESRLPDIPELEEKPLYADCRPEDSDAPRAIFRERRWREIASVNIL